MQILASKILGEIQHEYPEGERTDSTITFQELENNLQEAETLLNDAIDSYNDAKKDADNLYDVVEGYKEQRLSTGWHDQQAKWEMEYKEAKTKWDEAVNVRKEKEEERDKAKKAFTEADKAVKNYKKPQESIIAEFLSEMLKENSLIDNLESSISELNDAIVLQGENVNIVDNYSDLVEKTQVLTIVVEDYIALSKAISEEKGVTFLSQELMKEIIIPNPKSATFESEYITWKATWSEKINNLESLIHNLPEFSENELAELEKGETVVDTKMLNSYKANKMLNRLDELRRSKISDINVIEKATSLLFSKYFFTAWFSLALALVLDLSSLLAGLFIFSIQKKRAS